MPTDVHAGLTAPLSLPKRPHAAINHLVHRSLASPAAIPASHAEAIGELAGVDQPDGRPRRSVTCLKRAKFFKDQRRPERRRRVWSSRWRSHEPGDELRGEDGVQLRDQRLHVVVEKRRAVRHYH
jgi:hypothetical protein